MNEKKLILLIFFLIIPFYLGGLFYDSKLASAATTKIEATIKMTICGNNIKEAGEDCDNTDLTGKNCQSFGYPQGILSCKPSCEFNLANCYENNNNSNNRTEIQPESKVNFSGKAYPLSNAVLLKDGQIVSKTTADSNANFSMQVSDLSTGNYIFSIYGEDNKGMTSSTFVFSVKISQGSTTTIDNILIAPTINTNKNEVKIGDIITVSGQSTPQTDIDIIIDSEKETSVKTKTDNNGYYFYNLDTSLLEKGNYSIKSKISTNKETNYSKSIKFIVGESNVIKNLQGYSKSDLNGDGRINLVDFSIAAYWYKKPLSESFYQIEKELLNGDGKIDLIDFSIMAFYWNG